MDKKITGQCWNTGRLCGNDAYSSSDPILNMGENHMPKAVKRGNGQWRVQIFEGYDQDGKRIYKSITAKTKKEAESAAAIWIAERDERKAAEEREKARASIPTLDEAMTKFIETCKSQNYSPSTIAGYMKIQRNSFPSIIDKKVDEITAMDVQMAMDNRAANHAPKTVQNDYAFLHSILLRYCPDLNLSGTILAKKRKRAKRVFKQAWAPDIIQYIRDNLRTDFYIYALFIICSGCRPSEIYSFVWGDLSARPIDTIDGGQHYQVGTIRIDSASVIGYDGEYHEKDPKTDAGYRVLTLDWSFFQELYRVRPRGNPDDKIVMMKPGNCSKYWKIVKEHLGLPDSMVFYDLRHYFVTQLNSAGATDEEMASAMGHTSARFTHDVYIELFEEDQRRVSRTMANSTARLFGSIKDDEKNTSSAATK